MRDITLSDAVAAALASGAANPEQALLEHLKSGSLTAIAETYVELEPDAGLSTADDVEGFHGQMTQAEQAIRSGYLFGVREVRREYNVSLPPGFWIEVGRGLEVGGVIAWSKSWARHWSPGTLTWPPSRGLVRHASEVRLSRAQVSELFPILGRSQQSGGWSAAREAAAKSAFDQLVAESGQHSVAKEEAWEWLKARFPEIPRRAFVDRLWPQCAPALWKKAGPKRARPADS